jgi:hypothetical protein
MLKQLDFYLSTRMVLPWLPVFAVAHRLNTDVLTPQLFGSLAMVLSARLLAERAFSGGQQVIFCMLPLLGGGLVCAGSAAAKNYWWLGLVYYLAAGIGTVLAAVSDLRGRT